MELNSSTKRKYLKDLEDTFSEILRERLEVLVEETIKPLIMEKYDDTLVGTVTDMDSKANPLFYRDDFEARLEDFEFISDDGKTLRLPDMENFDFSGRLAIIQDIMEGTLGKYVEVTKEDFVGMFNYAPINQQPIDEYLPPDKRVYKVPYMPIVKKWFAERNKKIVFYPFSNTPPLRIFEEVNAYAEKNMEEWMDEVVKEVIKVYTRKHGGGLGL